MKEKLREPITITFTHKCDNCDQLCTEEQIQCESCNFWLEK